MNQNAISRRNFLGKLALGAAALAAPGVLNARGLQRKRPNILFLLADDQRADTVGAYGNPHVMTPNLDKLVAGGFSFRRNYCLGSSGGAVCVPSRAMIHSGRSYFNVDTRLRGVKIMAELLRENGYTTFGTGKGGSHEGPCCRSVAERRTCERTHGR